MFPTQTDLDFWESKTRPAWASKIKRQREPLRGSMIDHVVNAHAGERPTSSELETSNMCVFIRGRIRRGQPIVAWLLELADDPQGPNPSKRASLCRKWARRLGP